MKSLIARWRLAARQFRTETLALYYSIRDPRSPWYSRLAGGIVVAYALSPLDLIPDFVPVLGLADELVLLPLGFWLTVKLIPPQVMADNRARARAEMSERRPGNWAAAAVIVLIWIAAIAFSALVIVRIFNPH